MTRIETDKIEAIQNDSKENLVGVKPLKAATP